MRWLEGFRRKWGELHGEALRELDERQRLMRLLAVRDAFVALTVLSLLQPVMHEYLLRSADAAPIRNPALLPLYAAALASLVLLISWRLRGGGFPHGVAAFKTTIAIGSVLIGLLIGWLIVLLLAWADVMTPPGHNSPMGYLIGLGIAILIMFPLLRRKKPPAE